MTPTTFYNYTPHTITLNNGTSYGSVGVARVSNSFTDFDSDGVCSVKYGEVLGLPSAEGWSTLYSQCNGAGCE